MSEALESPPQEQIGKKIATQSPWVLIAILLHVAGVAVASIMYYARDSSTDDEMPTPIALTQQAVIEQVVPPDIVDREEVPKLKDQDILPSDLTEFDPGEFVDALFAEVGSGTPAPSTTS